ncbi:oxidoreductase [Cupriavidus sp. HPC(L)]|uniref:SDR family oxidoreductase n=1 Tax=Cupriavidus sp. HPC(L) TaxID=1217418 RepID=UPI000291250E|nr:SDR family oxidoreductase [Cupriavidus sp. HPC(L)]ESJ21485.1 oxidoreductase [Cupriavidus sp. HPC(L)]
MKHVILVTGASSGFGAMTAQALSADGHTVYASMRNIGGHNARAAADMRRHAIEHGVDLRPIELDVQSQDSADRAVDTILAEQGAIDVVVHNAGHMVFGPSEAFTVEQFAQLYDINVLGTQRVNRAALRHMRSRGNGLLVWVSSSSTRGGTPPYLGPYFAAKAAMDALAVSYAGELARWGIETAIIVPGSFTKGTNHYAHAGRPADTDRLAAYDGGPYRGLEDQLLRGMAALEPKDADAADVAREIARVVALPHGTRPLRTTIDPSDDGARVVNAMADRVRAELLRRIGLEDLLAVATISHG